MRFIWYLCVAVDISDQNCATACDQPFFMSARDPEKSSSDRTNYGRGHRHTTTDPQQQQLLSADLITDLPDEIVIVPSSLYPKWKEPPSLLTSTTIESAVINTNLQVFVHVGVRIQFNKERSGGHNVDTERTSGSDGEQVRRSGFLPCAPQIRRTPQPTSWLSGMPR